MKKIIITVFTALFYGGLCIFLGWLAGIDNGFDTGYKTAYIEMDSLLRQGISDRIGFSIKGLDVKFLPRGDSRPIVTVKREKGA